MGEVKLKVITLTTPCDEEGMYLNASLRLDGTRGWLCSLLFDSLGQVCTLLANHKISYSSKEDTIEFALGPQNPWDAIAMVRAIFQEAFNLQPPIFWYRAAVPREFRVETDTTGRHKATIRFDGLDIAPGGYDHETKQLAEAINRSGLCVSVTPESGTAACHVELTASAAANAFGAYLALVQLHPSLR